MRKIKTTNIKKIIKKNWWKNIVIKMIKKCFYIASGKHVYAP